MAPASSQKGTGKKGAGAIARQRSRNTTPSSVPPPASLPPIDVKQTEYLDLNYDSFRNLTYEDVVDQNAISSGMPESKNLDGMMTRLQRLQETLERRHNFCDRGMRLLVPLLRARLDDERSREEERLRREAAEDDERARKANKANKANKKKRKAADSLAPHDTNLGQSSIYPICARLVASLLRLHSLLVCTPVHVDPCCTCASAVDLTYLTCLQLCNPPQHSLVSPSIRAHPLIFQHRTVIPTARLQQAQKAVTRQRFHLLFPVPSCSCHPRRRRHGRRR